MNDKNSKQAATKEEEYNGKALKLLKEWIHCENAMKAEIPFEAQQKEIVSIYNRITR